jgi:hypothetical protein
MFKAVKAHPGVFVGGMITYAVLAHWVLPKYAPAVSAKLPTK